MPERARTNYACLALSCRPDRTPPNQIPPALPDFAVPIRPEQTAPQPTARTLPAAPHRAITKLNATHQYRPACHTKPCCTKLKPDATCPACRARPWLDFPIITNHARTCRGPPHLACQTMPCLVRPNRASPAVPRHTGSCRTCQNQTERAKPASPRHVLTRRIRPGQTAPRLPCKKKHGVPAVARRAKTRRCWTRRDLHRLPHLTQCRLN
jgi:hypothetical protein